LHYWYLIYGLPGVLLLLGLGVAGAGALVRRGGSIRGPVLVAALLVVLTGAAWSLPLGVYLERGKQQMKGAVVLMDRPVDPTGQAGAGVTDPLALGSWVAVPFYDPYCRVIYDLGVLEQGIAKARREGRGLTVAYGMRQTLRQLQPEILELLEDERVFEPVGMLPGLENAGYNTYVVRLREAPSEVDGD
jgi:hypothetical protein